MSNYNKVRLPPAPGKNFYRVGGEKLMDIEFGKWYPAGEEFLIPGDKVKAGQNAFIRTIPMVTVPFTSFHVKFVTFFTPLRLLEPNADKVIIGFDEEGNIFDGVLDPWKFKSGESPSKWSYYDYMGFQPCTSDVYNTIPTECKPADYWRKNLYRIYNEWLRDPQLQDEIAEDGNGYIYANYKRDRYTTALTKPQLGEEATIPIDTTNSVTFSAFDGSPLVNKTVSNFDDLILYNSVSHQETGRVAPGGYDVHFGNVSPQSFNPEFVGSQAKASSTTPTVQVDSLTLHSAGSSTYSNDRNDILIGNTRAGIVYGDFEKGSFNGWLQQNLNEHNQLNVDGGIGINDQRLAFAQQLLAERMARCGSRYNEYLRANFGIAPTDETLQRPVFLGSSQSPILVNEVTQTSATTSSNPLGDIAGKGVSISTNYTNSYLAKEFGILQTLMCIVPDVYYSQGIPKKFTYKKKMDFFNPVYQSLGEQEVLNSEIYVNGSSHGTSPTEDGDNGIWGFNMLYEELRGSEKRITGAFRDDLNTWTLARKFSERPNLNGDFIKCMPDRDALNRIFVSFDSSRIKPFHVHLYNDIPAHRPIIREPIPATLKGM